MNNKVIIFDLDGTLLDSLDDIVISVNRVLEKLDLPTHKNEAFREFVGDGARMLMQRALPQNSDKDTIDKALDLFTQIYSKTIHENTKPYDGIYEMLEALKNQGVILNLLSNKPQQFTRKYYDKFFTQFGFTYVYGQSDQHPKKPDPTTALKIAQNLQVDPSEIYFIGDTTTDILTAKNAGMKSIGVVWGIRDKNELITNGANHIINKPKEILNIVL